MGQDISCEISSQFLNVYVQEKSVFKMDNSIIDIDSVHKPRAKDSIFEHIFDMIIFCIDI